MQKDSEQVKSTKRKQTTGRCKNQPKGSCPVQVLLTSSLAPRDLHTSTIKTTPKTIPRAMITKGIPVTTLASSRTCLSLLADSSSMRTLWSRERRDLRWIAFPLWRVGKQHCHSSPSLLHGFRTYFPSKNSQFSLRGQRDHLVCISKYGGDFKLSFQGWNSTGLE